MNQVDQLSSPFLQELQSQVIKKIEERIERELKQLDINKIIQTYIEKAVASSIKKISLTGNNITGGIIKQFSSTGIQDNATACQVTVLDQATVVENKLVTNDLEIKGTVTIDGDLILNGEIPSDSPFFKDVVEHAAGILNLAMNATSKPRKTRTPK
jgi:4-hydroxyphenylpyruvate dioxygenase-like putative hemolysin